jgi:hypothetical protein
MSMRQDALRQFGNAAACDADADCVVMRAEIDCANVHLGDCGTLVNRAAESSLDWARTQGEICQAVEGSDFGCSVNVSCVALGAPRCERGVCAQDPVSAAVSEP